MISIAVAISELAPGASWSIDDEDYSTLVWWSPEIPKPSYEAVQAKLAELEAAQPLKAAQTARAAAYTTEADPLFFKAQRGEATIEEWQAKVAEIRSRYPYPQEAES
jgi:hypothetical protein